MRKFNDLTGKRFGRLVVISRSESNARGEARWLCKCDCGGTKTTISNYLTHGLTTSCGCYNKEMLSKSVTKHNMSTTRIYSIWAAMRRRCHDMNQISYCNYGGRGIEICDEWNNSFDLFYEWSTLNGYNSKLSIDRIDVNGNYCPENCKWSTRSEQNNNKRNNHLVTYKGKTLNVSQWEQHLNFKQGTLKRRLLLGWTIEKALTKPVRSSNR